MGNAIGSQLFDLCSNPKYKEDRMRKIEKVITSLEEDIADKTTKQRVFVSCKFAPLPGNLSGSGQSAAMNILGGRFPSCNGEAQFRVLRKLHEAGGRFDLTADSTEDGAMQPIFHNACAHGSIELLVFLAEFEPRFDALNHVSICCEWRMCRRWVITHQVLSHALWLIGRTHTINRC